MSHFNWFLVFMIIDNPALRAASTNSKSGSTPCFKIPLVFLIAVFALTGIIQGCQSYPMGLTKDEWLALSSTQQSDLVKTQDLLEQYNYNAQNCRKESEITVNTQVPAGRFGSSEKFDVKLGQDQKAYEACMQRLGWTKEKKQPIVNWIDQIN